MEEKTRKQAEESKKGHRRWSAVLLTSCLALGLAAVLKASPLAERWWRCQGSNSVLDDYRQVVQSLPDLSCSDTFPDCRTWTPDVEAAGAEYCLSTGVYSDNRGKLDYV